MSKISDLDELLEASSDDLVLVVNDPAGTPTSKSISVANLTQSVVADFDSRADAIVATIKTSADAIRTRGYASAGDGGGGLYKRITTPVPVEAWHFQSADGAYWELTYDTPCPEQFGAVRDGVTDDSTAINNAIGFVEASGGGDVRLLPGVYNIGTTTITVAHDVGLQSDSMSEFSYSGTSIALLIEGAVSPDLRERSQRLPIVTRSELEWDDATDTTSIGVEVRGCRWEVFHIPKVVHFSIGLHLNASTGNTVCNTFQLGMLWNNKVGIDMSPDPTPYGCNQNQFIGGQVNCAGAYSAVAGTLSINMPDTECNQNTFLGVNLEQGGQERAVYCNSLGNLFLNCRFEGSSSKSGYITFDTNAGYNKVIGQAAAVNTGTPFATMVTDNGFSNAYFMHNYLTSKAFQIDFNSTATPIKFGNASAQPAVPIGSFGTNRLRLGDSSTSGIRHYGYIAQEENEITTGTTITPEASFAKLNYASPATITGITGGYDATLLAKYVVIDLNGNITLQHTASPTAGQGKFVLADGEDLALSANTPITFTAVDGNLYQDVAYANSVGIAAGVTVSNLPTPSVGMIARVTDASAPSIGSTVTGGGAAFALVCYNGSNWTVMGV